ncbi:HEPN domain-containing protein [Halococcus salsus]|uniref:HEPN domain-containing protein n=1 Tax=Halococcus salsus TaxID=2162894 RepID=UPI0013576BDB|nr:HEPN domain-containing protein [Halococcus salsus]
MPRIWDKAIEDELHLKVDETWWELTERSTTPESDRTELIARIKSSEESINGNGSLDSILDNLDQVIETANRIYKNYHLNEIVDVYRCLRHDADEARDLKSDAHTELSSHYDFDLKDLKKMIQSENLDIKANDVHSRVCEVISNESERPAKEELDLDQISSDLAMVRSKIASEAAIEKYVRSLVHDLRGYMHGVDSLNDDLLQNTIKNIQAELLMSGWDRKALQKLLQRFSTEDASTAEDRVDRFCDGILEKGDKETLYIPMPNLPSTWMGEQVGAVKFHSVDSESLDIENRMGDRESFNKADFEAIAETTVEGPVTTIKTQKAKENISRSLDVINFGSDESIVQSPFYEPSVTYYRLNGDDEFEFMSMGWTRRYKLGRHGHPEASVKSKKEVFRSYLNHDTDTVLGSNFEDAIRWRRFGMQSPEPEQQFLNTIISLECLLAPHKNDGKYQVSERASKLLPIAGESEKSYKDKFVSAYDIRNRIVHDGARNIPELERHLKQLKEDTGIILQKTAEHLDVSSNLENLIDSVESEYRRKKKEIEKSSPFMLGREIVTSGALIESGDHRHGRVDMTTQLVEDGRFAYYEAKIKGFEAESPLNFTINEIFSIRFTYDGQTYYADPVWFPNREIPQVRNASDKENVLVRWENMESLSKAESIKRRLRERCNLIRRQAESVAPQWAVGSMKSALSWGSKTKRWIGTSNN